jgi:cell division protein FtsW
VSTNKKPVDAPFLLTVSALILFGLLIFTSAALALLSRDGATFTSVAVSQLLLGLVLGGILLFVFSRVDYKYWRPYTPYFFGFAVFLTILTLIPGIGVELKGASRWLIIGPISIQPEEILKFAAVAFLAAVYTTKIKTANTWMGGVIPLLLIGGLAAGLLLLQPNTDGAGIVLIATALMLFAAGGRLTHLGSLALLGIVAVTIAAFAYPHVASRFETFVHQGADPQGAGYQIQQSLIAVGSGEVTGRGFGQSIEKFSYLPEPIGDSIFAVAAEEFGFLGSVALILLYVLFGLLGLRIAARAPDLFGGLLVVGLVSLIVMQSFINISSTIGLIPLSGLPLIFVSHGGSALAIALAEVGVILSVSRRMKS